jgi:hypothetical protein
VDIVIQSIEGTGSLDRYIVFDSRNRKTRLGIEYIHRQPAYLPDRRCGAACRASEPGHRWIGRDPLPHFNNRRGCKEESRRDERSSLPFVPSNNENALEGGVGRTHYLHHNFIFGEFNSSITLFHPHNNIIGGGGGGGGMVGLKVFKEQEAWDRREDSHKRRKVSKSCVICHE